MTAKQLSETFLTWWQTENPAGRIYRNNTGVAFHRNKNGSLRPVAYGIPAPRLGRCYKSGGGGTDFISFRPIWFVSQGKTFIIAEFWEIKTLKDKISENQKDFYRTIIKIGGTINIVQEIAEGWEIVEWME